MVPFSVILMILALQAYNVNSVDPKLEQCGKKFLEQAKKIDFAHLPSCFDAQKLEEAKNHIKIFGKFYEALRPQCKHPISANIKDCMEFSNNYLSANSKEIQVAIVKSFNSLFEAVKNCIESAAKKFSGLDSYIAKGCTD